MNLTVNQTTNTNFKAKLTMATKEKFAKEAGTFWAEQLEKAKPTIEKIVNDTKDVKEIFVHPVLSSDKFTPSDRFLISALNNKNRLFTLESNPQFIIFDKTGKSFSEHIVDFLNTVIDGAKSLNF